MMVGLSMAITIIILIAAFIWIYVRLGPYLSDFIPSSTPNEATPVTEPSGIATPDTELAELEVPTPTPPPPPTPTWQPTHRLVADTDVNFRSGPNTISAPLRTIPPGTELQFLGERDDSGNFVWMRFQLEDGTEGWVREINTEAIN